MLSKLFRIFYFILGGMLTLYAVWMIFYPIWHTGVFLALFLGLLILSFGIFHDFYRRKLPLWLKAIFWSGCAVVTLSVCLLYGYGGTDTVTYQEDVLYVLGGGLKKDQPNLALARRLDRAILYYEKNPDVLIVVTGGQGPNEPITEGLAMERYLIERGIPKEQILREEASTSTYENFIYSQELLKEHLDGEYTVAFITTDYHIYRAERLAALAGYGEITHCHSDGLAQNVIASGIREVLAVVKLWLFRC